MNTLHHHTETEDETALQSETSRTTKLVLAGLFALGILDGYQDYVMFAEGKPPVPESKSK